MFGTCTTAMYNYVTFFQSEETVSANELANAFEKMSVNVTKQEIDLLLKR